MPILALLLFPVQTFAQSSCILKTSGTGFSTFEQDGQTFVYELSAVSLDWSLQGYGYHAAAALICENCSNRDVSWGLVHFNDTWSHRVNASTRSLLLLLEQDTENNNEMTTLDDARITTAKERARRRYEGLYYPRIILEGNELTALHSSESVRLSDFEGYAVVFEISQPSRRGIPESIDGLIAFELTDGCAFFSGTIALPLEDPIQQLEQLLSSLRIERHNWHQ